MHPFGEYDNSDKCIKSLIYTVDFYIYTDVFHGFMYE